jgi:capsular exopolysaccharide synthesis family protein
MIRSQMNKRVHKEAKGGDLSGCLVTISEPASAVSEAYRTLRTNLLYTQVDAPSKVIVITSPGSAEGKSTICANLGVVLAQAAKNTLIVDCDLRKPSLHKIFGLRNVRGMVDVLAERRDLHEDWQEACQELLPGLSVLTVGTLPPNPAELLLSRRFSEFLAGVRQEFDYVLVDSSPVGLVSDAAIIAAQADGVLLTFDAQRTRKEKVRQAVRSLRSKRANVLGTIMNNSEESEDGYYLNTKYTGGDS